MFPCMLIMDYSKREFFPTKKGESAMPKALLSALIVVICGYLGCFLDLAGCIIMTVASATACIVYTISSNRRD